MERLSTHRIIDNLCEVRSTYGFRQTVTQDHIPMGLLRCHFLNRTEEKKRKEKKMKMDYKNDD